MKKKVSVAVSVILLALTGVIYYFYRSTADRHENLSSLEENDELEEKEAAYQYLRWKYEADMVKDPTTGQALFGLRYQEIEFTRNIPQRHTSSPMARLQTQNNDLPAGPNNIGGRTRAIAYDVRYNTVVNGVTNRVLMAGGISGGIFRSIDGGANWTRVTPAGEKLEIQPI